MRLHYKILFVFLFVPGFLFAKNKTFYPVSEIPENLKKGADAVVREDYTELEVFSESKVVYRYKSVITILKESAKDKGYFYGYYDSLSSISDLKATVYDASGKKVETISGDEIKDYTAISGFSLYEDDRVKTFKPNYSVYPYTVEYSYVKKCNSALYMHGWYALWGTNTAVQKFSFKVVSSVDYKFSYLEHNLKSPGIISTIDNKQVIAWTLENIKAPHSQPFEDDGHYWIPMVDIAPGQFEMAGYKGSMESWKSYGKYQALLNAGRDNVPQETIDKIKEMLSEDMSDYEKIAAIYKYSQNKNRYVSIQDGIGGHQPFDAETVDRLSYGDCKALSNYVVSILKKFGYNACYTLVHSGDDLYENKDFVADYFNHAIACVPLQNDTIWLECTNPYYPCGYMSPSTSDRYVLLIKEEGGELVKTPSFKLADNLTNTTGEVRIAEDGSAEMHMKTSYKGANFSNVYGLLYYDEKDKKKKLIKSIDIPHFELDSFKLEAHMERKPSFDKTLYINVPSLGTKMGDRLIVSLNIMNQSTGALPYDRNRQSPMFIPYSRNINDTVSYIIPQGYKVEGLPNPGNVKSEFGEYVCSAREEDGKIIFERHCTLNSGRYPKEKYNEFVDWVEEFNQYEAAKAVLLKE